MGEYLDFMKNLFLCMLYFTGIIACFSIMIGFIEITIEKTRKKSNAKIINVNDVDLDEQTKKELDKIAEKIAHEILSDEYKKED